MSKYAGRHRAATPALSTRVQGARDGALRTGAVLTATGGLVAGFAAPAQSAPAILPVVPAAPAATGTSSALTAPTVNAPLTLSFGVIGVKAVAKPKPKPKPAPVVPVAASAATTTTTATVTAPSRSTPRSDSGTDSHATGATSGTTTGGSGGSSSPVTPTGAGSYDPPAPTGVLAIAKSLLGIPYVYGGSSPSTGFDCSGFTMYVFGQVGISLPRTAADQQAAATPVSNPQPGDLVFFGYPAYHVGIYAGGGMMYDSPHTGSVVSYRAIFSGVSGYGRP